MLLAALAAADAAHAAPPSYGQRREPRGPRELQESAAQAAAAIPFDQLTPEAQQKLAGVVTRPTLHHAIPSQTIVCDPDLFLFCVRNPEVIVNVWELMGVSNVTLTRAGPFAFDAADGQGTTARAELIYGDEQLHVVYADGRYEGPLFKRPVPGQGVLLLHTSFGHDRAGRPLVTMRMDLFLELQGVGAEVLARTFQPLVDQTADANFIETAGFLAKLSQAAEDNGPGVQHLAGRLSRVDEPVRRQFSEAAALASRRAAQRRQGPAGPPPSAVMPSSASQPLPDTVER